MRKFKVGDKVVPHKKTAGEIHTLESSWAWDKAKENKQDYLFVKSYDEYDQTWVLSNKAKDDWGDYFNEDDFTLYKEDEMSSDKLKEAYLVMQEASGIKVGDKVKVLRKAKSYENGWENNWIEEMDITIGQIHIVKYITKCGIVLGDPCKDYPFFVLEKIADAEPKDMVEFVKTKCDFGCQQENVVKLVEGLVDRIKVLEDM